MKLPRTVYLFRYGRSDRHGFTLRSDGSDLPSDGDVWRLSTTFSMTQDELNRFPLDTKVALTDLEERGFHICQLSATVLPFKRKGS